MHPSVINSLEFFWHRTLVRPKGQKAGCSARLMSDAENPAVGGDDLMSPHELLEELDTDGSGWIESDEFENRDSIDKELDKIRLRRSRESRGFPRGLEDFVLIGGLIYGILFFGGTLAMSAGLLGNTVSLDQNLSDTFLDFENCTDPGDEVWLHAWIDDSHNIRIDAFNVPAEAIYTTISYSISDGDGTKSTAYGMNATMENSTTIKIDYSNWFAPQTYVLHVVFTNNSSWRPVITKPVFTSFSSFCYRTI